MTQDQLIQKCLKQDRKAQKVLYERFGPTMKMVCLRYLFEKDLAEEVMNQGFMKVFSRLDSYGNNGSFEGWIRRIMVNQCLDQNRKKGSQNGSITAVEDWEISHPSSIEAHHDLKFILWVIESLPMGLKTIFNLIEIEGFSHKEVSEELGITESASRSQLSRAKKILKEKLQSVRVK
ncbi:MAG: sigma-70 family RNA polymerase sigma factor [Bacteroidota bacterium]|nr:sigma-70 family RNA polymerase sigma factor [Bacteroidota bacterium]